MALTEHNVQEKQAEFEPEKKVETDSESPPKQPKMAGAVKPTVGIVNGSEWLKQCNKVPNIRGRVSINPYYFFFFRFSEI